MEVILTHKNADFDAVAALLAAHKLYPEAKPLLPERLNANVRSFLTLYRGGLPFEPMADFPRQKIDRVILVDTQRVPDLRGLKKNTPVLVIDHHPVTEQHPDHYTLEVEEIGSTATLLVEKLRERSVKLTSLEATLLALGVYEDTGSLTYAATSTRDLMAAAWLLEQSASLKTVRRFLEPPLSQEQQTLFNMLLQNAETRLIHGYPIIVSSARIEAHVSGVNSVTHRLNEVLDPAALFVVVRMPDSLLLVCRARMDGIDVSEIAVSFGGGGHERAAAVTLYDDTQPEDILPQLWQALHERVNPPVRVEDLMSYGVQTVSSHQQMKDLVRRLRRIGHEGFPVVDGGHVIGLLTRRDADRAVEHGLGEMTAREVMSAGAVAVHPSDSVYTLEQRMVESGWGQIPVLSEEDERLIGIVTRTDLINHWARTHPTTHDVPTTVDDRHLTDVLGEPTAVLINTISAHAKQHEATLYLVGGVVRDLLLYRKNLDIDFVVEEDAIVFAEGLRVNFGGKISPFRPFGTAKWILDDAVAEALGVPLEALPPNVDFATARNEFYEHPTALPTVYNSSIKLDMARRDFTINALAVQLSPESADGHILDFYGGLKDLQNGLIRVLHSLSFVDDPTRILRALRFEHRLNFRLESRTEELIETALPMLGRITGERVRNELDLLLHEHEPEHAIQKLDALGVPKAVHPDFVLPEHLDRHFKAARTAQPDWLDQPVEPATLYWHILLFHLETDAIRVLCARLMIGKQLAESIVAAASLYTKRQRLRADDAKPSEIVRLLDEVSETAVAAVAVVLNDATANTHIERFMSDWRYVKSTTDGHDLKAMGLKPGPAYRVILEKLRSARLDGDVTTDDEERRLLNRLINETIGSSHNDES